MASSTDRRAAQLNELYAAFNRRDVDAVLAWMTPDVRWPNGWEGGHVEGQAAVRDYWRRQWEQIDPTVTPQGFAAQADGRAAVTVRQVVRDRAGRTLSDQIVIHTYRFAGDLIQTMDIDKPD